MERWSNTVTLMEVNKGLLQIDDISNHTILFFGKVAKDVHQFSLFLPNFDKYVRNPIKTW